MTPDGTRIKICKDLRKIGKRINNYGSLYRIKGKFIEFFVNNEGKYLAIVWDDEQEKEGGRIAEIPVTDYEKTKEKIFSVLQVGRMRIRDVK